MKNVVERMAKSVDEAIDQCLKELNIQADDAIIEVLDEGEAGGLLGFGRRPARVRVSRAVFIEEDENSDSERYEDELDSEFDGREDEYEDYDSDDYDSEGEYEELDFDEEEDRDEEEGRDSDRREQKSRGRRGQSGRRRAKEFKKEDVQEEVTPLTDEEKAEIEDIAVEFVATVLQSLDIHGRISSFYDAFNTLHIDVSGDDIGNAIGRRGETLYALQYLSTQAINKGRDKYVRLYLDIGRYRERRTRSLRQDARRFAGKVLSTGRRFVMDPMNSADRRQVHMTLADFEGVTTYSDGREPRRRVVIVPSEEE